MRERGPVKRSNPDDRRAEIISAARELYEQKGLAHTTVKDITEAVGVTRSLFYHYFPDKDAVTEAVLDDFVDEFREMTELWADTHDPLDIRTALRDCIAMLRVAVFDKDSFRIDLASNENASLYLSFSSKAAEVISKFMTERTAIVYGQYHEVNIEHVYDMCYMLFAGMVGYMRNHPDAPTEVLESLVAQTLRLDLDNEHLVNNN